MLFSIQALGSPSPRANLLGSIAVIGALALALAAAGCADPDGQFEAFGTRYDQDNATSTAPFDAGPCPPTKVGEADGDYFFTLAAKINKKKPLALLAKLTTQAMGAGVTFKLDLQPLLAADQKTPTGVPFNGLGPYAVASDGSFTAALPELTVPGNGNPVTGTDLVATVTLAGHLCGKGDFICGDVTGNVTKPLPLDLKGSSFTLQRITDPTKYPTPLIDCAKTAP